MQTIEKKDEFDMKLDEMTKHLQKCQNEKKSSSCFECEKLLDCETRNDYVKSVYESMSKGQTGGFDF